MICSVAQNEDVDTRLPISRRPMHSATDSKYFLFGLAMVGWASGCVEPELGLTAQAEAGSVCAFVTGTVGGQTITTPSVAVIVPDTAITTDPIRVHVDETG